MSQTFYKYIYFKLQKGNEHGKEKHFKKHFKKHEEDKAVLKLDLKAGTIPTHFYTMNAGKKAVESKKCE